MTLTEMPELTELQHRFVENLLDCPSATEAYRRAGGRATSDKSAFQQASRLMGNDDVQAALRRYKEARAKLAIVDSAWIKEQLVLLILRASQAVPVFDSEGNETGVWKADNNAANQALRTLAMMKLKDDEKQKETPIRSYEVITASLVAKLGLDTDHFDGPTEADFEEMKKVGAINLEELRTLRRADRVREQIAKRSAAHRASPSPTSSRSV